MNELSLTSNREEEEAADRSTGFKSAAAAEATRSEDDDKKLVPGKIERSKWEKEIFHRAVCVVCSSSRWMRICYRTFHSTPIENTDQKQRCSKVCGTVVGIGVSVLDFQSPSFLLFCFVTGGVTSARRGSAIALVDKRQAT